MTSACRAEMDAELKSFQAATPPASLFRQPDSAETSPAARNGADPSLNSKLRLVLEQARKVSMPKETLERAIIGGTGKYAGANGTVFSTHLADGSWEHVFKVE